MAAQSSAPPGLATCRRCCLCRRRSVCSARCANLQEAGSLWCFRRLHPMVGGCLYKPRRFTENHCTLSNRSLCTAPPKYTRRKQHASVRGKTAFCCCQSISRYRELCHLVLSNNKAKIGMEELVPVCCTWPSAAVSQDFSLL